jgi:hypothetical protein
VDPLSDAIVSDDDLSVPYGAIQTDSDYSIPEYDVTEAIQYSIPPLEPDEYVTQSESPTPDVGTAIDNAIRVEVPESASEPKSVHETLGFGRRRQSRRNKKGDPKSTAPDVDEWLDFFSRIVIRFLTEWYADYMFRGIDEDRITDADAAKLVLTEEERDTIGRPFAEFANKNPFLKKHGRQIVAFSDSFESAVILGRFFMRVNRIAAKYKPEKPKAQRPNVRLKPEGYASGNNGQSQASAESTQGPIPDGYPIFNPGGS